MGDDAVIAGFAPQSVQSCLESMDAFCQQDCPMVTSFVSVQQSITNVDDIAKEMAKILGVEVSTFDDPTKIFEDMGVDSFAKVELKHFIDSHTDLVTNLDEIKNMTMPEIKAMIEKAQSKEDEVGHLFASDQVNLIPILKHKEALLVLLNEVPGDPVFIVNIGDIDVNYYQSLANELRRPTFAFVWTDDGPSTDIGSLASWYLKIIQETVAGPFHVVGCSIGGSVAFEMAMQCQNGGVNLKTITLVSGSYDLMNALNKDETDVMDFEVTVLCRFIEQFTAVVTERLKNELTKEKSQEQRIQMILKYLADSSRKSEDKNDLLEAITNYLKKCRLVHSYIPSGKLSMDINIIESTTKVLANDITGINELISKICSGNISIIREFYSCQFTKIEDAKKIAKVLDKCFNK